MVELDYKNGDVLFKVLSRLKELRLTYYINTDGVVVVKWMGEWKPYHVVMKYDGRLLIEAVV